MSIGTVAAVFCVKSKTMHDMADSFAGIWYDFYGMIPGCSMMPGRRKITKREEKGMTEKRNKNVWHMFRGLCVVLLVGLCLEFGTVNAEAASAKSKAMKAYKNFLSGKTIAWDESWKVDAKDCQFAFAYIDNDSIPEMILYCPKASHVAGFGRLYTYRKGKVRQVASVNIDGSKFSYYKKKGIYVSQYVMGGVCDSYFKLSKGKSSLKLQKEKRIFASSSETSCMDGKRKVISKSKFNKELKKLVGSKKKTTIKLKKFHNNTANNRKKYCK